MRQDTDTVILFAFVFLACPVLYFLLRALPYLIFYALPFLLSAVILRSVFAAICQIEPVDFRRTLVLFPIAAVVLMMTIVIPSDFPQVPLKPKLESVWLFNAFNAFKSQIESFINWTRTITHYFRI